MRVNLCGIELDNPIIPASGTFGYGYEFAELYDINMLGTFSFKGTTKDARFGNPTPRIAECEAGMINAVGLQNPGVEKVISEELPKLAKCFDKKVMANVSGFSIEDYAYTCAKLDKCEQPCPGCSRPAWCCCAPTSWATSLPTLTAPKSPSPGRISPPSLRMWSLRHPLSSATRTLKSSMLPTAAACPRKKIR